MPVDIRSNITFTDFPHCCGVGMVYNMFITDERHEILPTLRPGVELPSNVPARPNPHYMTEAEVVQRLDALHAVTHPAMNSKSVNLAVLNHAQVSYMAPMLTSRGWKLLLPPLGHIGYKNEHTLYLVGRVNNNAKRKWDEQKPHFSDEQIAYDRTKF